MPNTKPGITTAVLAVAVICGGPAACGDDAAADTSSDGTGTSTGQGSTTTTGVDSTATRTGTTSSTSGTDVTGSTGVGPTTGETGSTGSTDGGSTTSGSTSGGSSTGGETGTTGEAMDLGTVIVWGGWDGAPAGGGAIYDVETDTWSTPPGLSDSPIGPRSYHCGVWTGDEMIIWGGSTGVVDHDDGAIYDPVADSWSSPAGLTAGQALARRDAGAVWTGDEMIVWGGYLSGTGDLDDGAVYDPALDAWTTPTGLNASPLSVRRSATVVWTGDEMIVWGGIAYDNGNWLYRDDGAVYDPSTDTWSSPAGLSSGANLPSGRSTAAGAWTGDQMIMWAGSGANGPSADGASYDPLADAWSQPTELFSGSPLEPRSYPRAVWIGLNVVIWGGNNTGTLYGNGATYDPDADAWGTPAGLNGGQVPSARRGHSAVWTGG